MMIQKGSNHQALTLNYPLVNNFCYPKNSSLIALNELFNILGAIYQL